MSMDTKKSHFSALVLVLGAVSQSPRMQYHASSLLNHGYTVTLVGYPRDEVFEGLQAGVKSGAVKVRTVEEKLSGLFKSFKPLYYAVRLFALTLLTLWKSRGTYSVVLLQTPPFLPTIVIGYVCSVLYSSRWFGPATLCVDWHNIGFTMFEESQSSARSVVRASERVLGSALPAASLCVTEAMKRYLREEFGVVRNVHVMHDRPTNFMRSGTGEEAHDMWRRLEGDLEEVRSKLNIKLSRGKTTFTDSKFSPPCRRSDRPLMLMSSTSWTPDEDFSILLSALVSVDKRAKEGEKGLEKGVVVFVTGKGPLKEHYEGRVKELGLKRVVVKTLWLEVEDYPKLIGEVDAGISLHTSTSGVDLPMKILDMFGCGVPVLAMGFSALPELVTDGSNGLVFQDSEELEECIMKIAREEGVELMRERVMKGRRWEEEWDEVVWKGVFDLETGIQRAGFGIGPGFCLGVVMGVISSIFWVTSR